MKLVCVGDAIKPCPPNFELKINSKLGAMPVSITFYGIGEEYGEEY